MIRKALVLAAYLGLAVACDDGGSKKPNPSSVTQASAWVIGPEVYGKNKSVGMPLHPTAEPGGGWSFTFPQSPGSVHEVSFRHGPLTGKTRITVRFRVEMAEGVKIVPVGNEALPSILTVHFQRKDDDWSAQGPKEAYRWWATFAAVMPIEAGEHEISVPMDGPWTAILASHSTLDPANTDPTYIATFNPYGFKDAVDNTEWVGLAFGGNTGYSHGVYATGPARFILEEFRVE